MCASAAQSQAAAADSGRIDPALWRMTLTLIVGALAAIFDSTIMSVAIDDLARQLHTSLGTVQWVSTAYLLTLGATIPAVGWAQSVVGGKRLWIIALGAFDVVGLLLLSPGVATAVYGLSQLGGPGGLREGLPSAAGLVLIAGYVGWALWRGPDALVNVRLLRHRALASSSVLVFLSGAALFGPMLLLPLYWQQVRGAGLGVATIALMGAAFVGLERQEIPGASIISRVAQQVGGSAGTAVLAMILQRTSTGAHTPAALASGFGDAFWWATAITAMAVPLCLLLPGRTP